MSEVLVGHCGVDSGQGWIGDPCYVMEDMFSGGDEPTGGMYDECCRMTLSDEKAGEAALGVASATNYGDGSYPVYVTYARNGRPLSLRSDFAFAAEGEDEDRCDWCHRIFGDTECGCECECECNCECNDDDGEDTQ